MLAEIAAGDELAAQIGKAAARGIDLAVVMDPHDTRGVEPLQRPDLPLEPSRLVLVNNDLQHEFIGAGAREPTLTASALRSDGLSSSKGPSACVTSCALTRRGYELLNGSLGIMQRF